MTLAEVGDRLEAYIRSQFRVSPSDTRFSRSQRLFEMGYIDSVGVVELLAFLTEEFHVALPDEALMSDEFSTIDGVAGLVYRYQNGGAASPAEPPTAADVRYMLNPAGQELTSP
jgi:acyl carrier protein